MALWYRPDATADFGKQPINLDRNPCPTIMAGGINGRGLTQYWLEDDGMGRVLVESSSGLNDGERIGTLSHAFIDASDTPMPTVVAGRSVSYLVDGQPTEPRTDPRKPPYRIPSMAEVRAIPKNGLTVASTFAGGGGSSTGYRMAGFTIVWANEIGASARESYGANMDPATVLNGQDIRQITAEDILKATGLKAGELDVFDGSPPCVSFSTAGKRERGWGRVTASHDTVQRQDDLFYEFARLLKGLQPKVFIAENVSGLIKGTAKGYFLEILRALRACGYKVEAQLLDAQWLGVPQMRQRLIFLGVRNDLAGKPAFPAPLPYRYTVRDALPEIFGARVERVYVGKQSTVNADTHASPTILATDGNRSSSTRDQGLGFVETRVVHETGHSNDPDSPNNWGCGDVTDRPAPAVVAGAHHLRVIHDTSGAFSEGDVTEQPSPTLLAGRSATLQLETTPELRTFKGTRSADKPAPTIQTHGSPKTFNELSIEQPHLVVGDPDFRQQPGNTFPRGAKASIDAPSPGVQARPASIGGAITHSLHTGTERRKFTIAEVKRICSFPDDYVLRGSYADQWARCGNAVPPLMMRAIAEVVRDKILLPLRE